MDAEDCPKTHPLELAISFLTAVYFLWISQFEIDIEIAKGLGGVAIPLLMIWEPKHCAPFVPGVFSHRKSKIIGWSILLILVAFPTIEYLQAPPGQK